MTGGTDLRLTFSSTLTVDDNFSLATSSPGTSLVLDNGLGLAYSDVTSVQSILIDAEARLRYADLAGGSSGGEVDFEDPALRLRYTREGARSRLALDARYRTSDLTFSEPLTDDIEDPADLLVASGTRKTTDLGITYETGIDAPLGVILEARRTDRDYSETIDPDLFDNTRDTLSATLRMRLSPVMEGRLTAARENYVAEDLEFTDRTTTSLSFGLDYAVSSTMTLDASLGRTAIDTIRTLPGIGRVERETSGLSTSVGLTQEMVNGSARVSLSNAFEAAGHRTTLLFGRDMEITPGADLSASIGLTRNARGDVEPVVALSYGREMRSGRIEASLNRGISLDDEEDTDVRTTRVALGITNDINRLSSLGLTFDYGRTEGGTTSDDVARTNMRAAYNYALTPDWDMSVGYLWRKRSEAGVGSATSNAVFLTLNRTLDLRP